VLTRKPIKGDRVAWRLNGKMRDHATVLRTEGTLCWIKPDDGSDSAPFIWWFPRDNAFNCLAEIIGRCEVTSDPIRHSELAT
jgi:hypothetical protein